MANRSDIVAGKAHVVMSLKKDALVAGLKSVQSTITSAGKGMIAIGGGVAAIGASITGPLLAAVNSFAGAGDELNKMSDRTGIAVSALSELKYAAAQSGADLATLEGGMRKMQDSLGEAAKGSDSAIAKFTALGLSVTDLMAMTPDQQFKAIAQGISEIQDPALRTAATIDVLGKSGTNLLPMMLAGKAGIEQLEDAGRKLGVTMSKEDANAATLFGDTMADLQTTIMSVVNAAGAALAPMLTDVLKIIIDVASAVTKWIRENRELFVTIFKIGAGLVAAGTAIAAVGAGLIAAGSVIGAVVSAIGAIGPILAAVFSPVGLIVAAIAAIGVGIVLAARHWLFFTESGKKALAAIQGFFKPFVDAIKTAFGGIADAFKAGNLGLAVSIAVEGMKVVFFMGIDAIIKRIMFIPRAIIDSLRTVADLDPTGLLNPQLDAAQGMLAGIAAAPGAAAAAAQAQLEKLTAQAAAERASKEAAAATEEKKKYVPGGEEADPVAAAVDKMKSFGSFSVSALTMQNWGKNPQDKVVNVLERTYEEVVSGRKAIVTAIKEAAPAYGP